MPLQDVDDNDLPHLPFLQKTSIVIILVMYLLSNASEALSKIYFFASSPKHCTAIHLHKLFKLIM